MGRCTDRRDMTKAVESGVKLQTNKQKQTSTSQRVKVFGLLLSVLISVCRSETFRDKSKLLMANVKLSTLNYNSTTMRRCKRGYTGRKCAAQVKFVTSYIATTYVSENAF